MTKVLAVIIVILLVEGCAAMNEHNPTTTLQKKWQDVDLTIFNYADQIDKACNGITNYGGLSTCLKQLADAADKTQASCEEKPTVDTCGPGGTTNHGKLARWYRDLARDFQECQKGKEDPCSQEIYDYNAVKKQRQRQAEKAKIEKGAK